MNIGSYLKQLRIDKGYTLTDVANKLGMSASFLSQLENLKLSPSLDSLEKLLCFYSINLSEFFRQIEQKRSVTVKKIERESFCAAEGAIRISLLASKLQNNSLETYLIEFKNNAELETAILPKEINGERFIYIIKGKVFISIDNDELVEFGEGDSINYKSYISCRITETEGYNSELIISGMPPVIMNI